PARRCCGASLCLVPGAGELVLLRLTMTDRTRLAVLGSPIAHSKSPIIHTAAYRALGLPWEYSAIELTADELPRFVRDRDASWRGLSLTMPLKRDVLPLLHTRHRLVE